MAGLSLYLNTSGNEAIGNVTLGEGNWPTNKEDFMTTMFLYFLNTGLGAAYVQEVSFFEDGSEVEAI